MMLRVETNTAFKLHLAIKDQDSLISQAIARLAIVMNGPLGGVLFLTHTAIVFFEAPTSKNCLEFQEHSSLQQTLEK